MRRRTRIVPIAAILVAGVVFGDVPSYADPSEDVAGTPPAPTLSLAGRWKLNVQKSDDARKMMREARQGRSGDASGRGGMPPGGPGGGMGGPRGGGRGGGGGRGPGGGGRPPGSAENGDDRRESMRAVFEAASELLVTPTANEVVILEKDGRLRTLHPDGNSYKSEGGTSETKTRWEGARLVVESKDSSGARIVETFALASTPAGGSSGGGGKAANEAPPDVAAPGMSQADPRTMTVTVRVEGTRMPSMTLTRIYDQVATAE
jgi:hypothetical protein